VIRAGLKAHATRLLRLTESIGDIWVTAETMINNIGSYRRPSGRPPNGESWLKLGASIKIILSEQIIQRI